MSSTGKTPNYALSQWASGDMLTHGDVNTDNAILDAALKSLADSVSDVGTQLIARSFCRMLTGTYTGTGVFGQGSENTLTFSVQPKLVVIMKADEGYNGHGMNIIVAWGLSTVPRIWLTGDSYTTVKTAYSGNTMTWYNQANEQRQMNVSGTTYAYVAFA
jgi:hypothetical protein